MSRFNAFYESPNVFGQSMGGFRDSGMNARGGPRYFCVTDQANTNWENSGGNRADVWAFQADDTSRQFWWRMGPPSGTAVEPGGIGRAAGGTVVVWARLATTTWLDSGGEPAILWGLRDDDGDGIGEAVWHRGFGHNPGGSPTVTLPSSNFTHTVGRSVQVIPGGDVYIYVIIQETSDFSSRRGWLYRIDGETGETKWSHEVATSSGAATGFRIWGIAGTGLLTSVRSGGTGNFTYWSASGVPTDITASGTALNPATFVYVSERTRLLTSNNTCYSISGASLSQRWQNTDVFFIRQGEVTNEAGKLYLTGANVGGIFTEGPEGSRYAFARIDNSTGLLADHWWETPPSGYTACALPGGRAVVGTGVGGPSSAWPDSGGNAAVLWGLDHGNEVAWWWTSNLDAGGGAVFKLLPDREAGGEFVMAITAVNQWSPAPNTPAVAQGKFASVFRMSPDGEPLFTFYTGIGGGNMRIAV